MNFIDNTTPKGNKMNATNFVIKANGTTNGLSEFIAVTPEGKLLATISPRFNGFKYSPRFLNVCFNDGKVEIADREEGEFETEHAAELIAAKLFN